jgi:hypothetical protein
MLALGLYPNPLVKAADNAASALGPQTTRVTASAPHPSPPDLAK